MREEYSLKSPGNIFSSDSEIYVEKKIAQGAAGDGVAIIPVTAITPLSYPNLLAWYNSTSFSDTGGGLCNTAVDRSGNGRDLTLKNSGNFPVYNANALNGLAGIGELTADEGLNGNYTLGPFTGYT